MPEQRLCSPELDGSYELSTLIVRDTHGGWNSAAMNFWTIIIDSPQRPRTCFDLDGIGTARMRQSQDLLAEWQQNFAAPVGEEAEEANADEAVWKHMQEEAAQKLLDCDRHQLLLAAVGVILPAERDLAIGEVDDPVIGDGNAVGVAGQVRIVGNLEVLP